MSYKSRYPFNVPIGIALRSTFIKGRMMVRSPDNAKLYTSLLGLNSGRSFEYFAVINCRVPRVKSKLPGNIYYNLKIIICNRWTFIYKTRPLKFRWTTFNQKTYLLSKVFDDYLDILTVMSIGTYIILKMVASIKCFCLRCKLVLTNGHSLSGALVYWLYEETRNQKVVSLSPGTRHRTDIFHIT